MKRSTPNDRPKADKVINIHLPEDRTRLRAALVVAALVIAVASFAYGVNALVSTDAGVQEITALTGEMNASDDFTLYYNLGQDGADATDERREIRSLYTEAATDAFEIFSADSEFEDRHNVWYLNRHPNEEVVVDAALYDAFELLEAYGARYHYLAPFNEFYTALFASATDAEAAEYDPRLNAAVGDFFAEAIEYARDPGHVSVELLGDNTVRLAVSDEYLAYAEENGIGRFIDFSWLGNAFIADYIAGVLTGAGYDRGALMSTDGYMRSFDSTGTEYSFTFTHREGNTVSGLATLSFSGTVSIVYLRDYPADASDTGSCYTYAGGTLRSAYLDPADGLDRTALPELAAYSYDGSCAETALMLAPLYIAGDFDESGLEALADSGVSVYYTENGELQFVEARTR